MKTKEEVLDQLYISREDLQILIPKLGRDKAMKYINETIEEMKNKGYLIPDGKTKLALTKLIRKKFGF